jgi:hypothetical protein
MTTLGSCNCACDGIAVQIAYGYWFGMAPFKYPSSFAGFTGTYYSTAFDIDAKTRYRTVKFEMWVFSGVSLVASAYQWMQVTIDQHSGALTAKSASWAGFTNGLHQTFFNTSWGGSATAATGGDEVDTDADGIPDTRRTLWAVTLSDPYTLDDLKTDVEGLYGLMTSTQFRLRQC